MAETKGITITFKGDTVQFDKDLQGVNKALKTLKSEMNTINKQLKLDPKNVDLLRQKFGNLQQQQKVLTEQVKVYEEDIKKLGDKDIGSNKWVKLNTELEKAKAELATIDKQVDTWGKANLDMVAFGRGLQDASKKTKQLADDLKGVSTAGMAVATALSAVTINAGKQADDINTLAKQYNLTTEEIQKFQMASDLIDVDLNTITKSYARLTKNMTSTSTDVQNAFKTLGVAVTDANGDLRDSGDVFNELINALGDVENETLQDNLAMQIFGKGASELGSLINGGADQLQEFNKYLEENGLLLSQDELDALNDMNDALDLIKATLKGLQNSVAKSLAPMFQSAFEKINKAVLKLKEVWDSLSPSVQQAIPIIAGIVGAVAPLLTVVSLFQDKIGKLVEKTGFGNSGLGGILSKIASPVGIAVTAFGLLYATNEKFREAVNGLVKSLAGALQPIIQTVTGSISNLISTLSSYLSPIIDYLVNILTTYIIPALNTLISAVMPVLNGVLEVLFGIVEKLVEWIGKLWQYLEDRGVIDAVKNAFESLGEIISGVVQWVKDLFGWFTSLIDKAREFLGLNGQIANNAPLTNGRGIAVNYGSGGYSSGGYNLSTNVTINNYSQPITGAMANRIVDQVNRQLGAMLK